MIRKFLIQLFHSVCSWHVGLAALCLFHSLVTGWLAVISTILTEMGMYSKLMKSIDKIVMLIVAFLLGIGTAVADVIFLQTRPTAATGCLGAVAFGNLLGLFEMRLRDEAFDYAVNGIFLGTWVVSYFIGLSIGR